MTGNVKRPPMSEMNSSRSYAQRQAERLTPEEAMRAAIRMMSAYSEFSPCNPEYLMTLAETLCQFPMEVATAACSPVHGVPKEYKTFRPNSGQVSEWCERKAGWLARMAERERPALPPPEAEPRSQRPALEELLQRAAARMGREVVNGHLTQAAEPLKADDGSRGIWTHYGRPHQD
jgi:hypothetical protein